jgi:membrane protein DedA with SNARE-associated domain
LAIHHPVSAIIIMSSLFHGAGALAPYIASYGVLALFLIVYLESLGLPLPGESALITAGVLAADGELAVGPVLLAVWLGAVVGDSTGYAIGRLGGRPLLLRFGPYVKLPPDRLGRLEALFRSKGVWIVLSARFVVVLRQLNGLIAGSVAMPWSRFVAANAAGAALWVAVWGIGSYLFADLVRSLR